MDINFGQILRNSLYLVLVSCSTYKNPDKINQVVNSWTFETRAYSRTAFIVQDTVLKGEEIFIDDFAIRKEVLDSIARIGVIDQDYLVDNLIITILGKSTITFYQGEDITLTRFFIRRKQSSHALAFVYFDKIGAIIKEYGHGKAILNYTIDDRDTINTQFLVIRALKDTILFPPMPAPPPLP